AISTKMKRDGEQYIGGARIKSHAMAENQPAGQNLSEDDSGPDDPGAPERTTDWTDVVDRIRQGDPAALEELYLYFGRGARYFLMRRLGNDELEDRVHDVFLIVAAAIRNGELRDPARLPGYVKTVVRRTIAGVIEESLNSRVSYMDLESGMFSMADWRL